jgi:hypothetical protein
MARDGSVCWYIEMERRRRAVGIGLPASGGKARGGGIVSIGLGMKKWRGSRR